METSKRLVDTEKALIEDSHVTSATRERLSAYLSESSVHGVAYLAKRDTSGARRCVWLLIILAGFTLLSYMIVQSARDYYKFESTISFSREQQDSLPFPAVTFCNKNTARKTPTVRIFGDQASIQQEGHYSSFSIPYNITGWNVSRVSSHKHYDLVSQLVPQVNDTFLQCRISHQLVNCADYVVTFNSNQGICYTFQSYEHVQRNGGVTMTSPGENYGLSFTLNADKDEYYMPNSFGVGFSVIIHDVTELPRVDLEPIDIGPGKATAIALQKETHSVLPRPYSKEDCTDDALPYDEELALGYPYSQNACQFSCIFREFNRACGCDYFKDCTYGTIMQCILNVNFFMERAPCRCLKTCRFHKYIKQISSADFPNVMAVANAVRNNFTSQTEQAMRANLLELTLYYSSMDVTYITQNPKYQPQDIFSTIGGLMGLFLGISLISVLEFVHFLLEVVRALVCALRERLNAKQ